MGGRFTANLGLRGDFLQGKNPEVGKVYDSANWAPRLGFAWDVAGDASPQVVSAMARASRKRYTEPWLYAMRRTA